MTLPVDLQIILDGSQKNTFTLAGALAQQGYRVDTAGLAVQVTAGLRPTYDYRCQNGSFGIQYGGSGAPLFNQPSYLTQSAAPFSIPYTAYFLAQCDGVATLGEISQDVTSHIGIRIRSDTAPTIEITGPGGTITANASAGWFINNIPGLVRVSTDGTLLGTVMTLNGVAVSLTPSGTPTGSQANTTVPATYGAAHGGAEPMTGSEGFIAIIQGRAATVTDDNEVLAYLNSVGYYIPPQGQPQIEVPFVAGNSIAAGLNTNSLGTDKSYSFASYASAMIGSRIGGTTAAVANNFAIAGALLTTDDGSIFSVNTQIATNLPTVIAASVGKKIIGFIEGGVNDISTLLPASPTASITDALTIIGYMSTVLDTCVSLLNGVSSGPHVLVVSGITRNGSEGNFAQYCRQVYNQQLPALLILKSTSNVRFILGNVGADFILSNTYPFTFQPNPAFDNTGTTDLQHPTKAGQQHYGGLMGSALIAAGV